VQDTAEDQYVKRAGTGVSVCVAIVTYNSAREIGACISSLAMHCPPDVAIDVKVVDNASTDGTARVPELSRDWVDLQVSSHNDGFAVSTNRSIRDAKSDYVLVLNPDTQLKENVLARLIDVLESSAEVGVVGCRLELADGTLDHACKRAFPTPSSAAKYFVERSLRLSSKSPYVAPDVDEFGSGEVDAINGALMLIRRTALDEVGLLDEAYWMYGEDLDWCRRFKLAGWKVFYEGSVTAVHLKGRSSGQRRAFKVDWHFHRSMWRFYWKFDGRKKPVVDVLVAVAISVRFFLSAAMSLLGRFQRLGVRNKASVR
jgi:N-acetylglucosaminyl-diphospho-decaprenol L-rhamnosyltransferase